MSDLEPVNPLKDESNATSVINLVPTAMATRLKAIPEYVFDMEMKELEEKANVGQVERKIRVAFWLEYERAHRNGTPVRMASVYQGTCSMGYFFKNLITNSFKLAYILTPPEDYRVVMEEMLMLAMEEERQILQTPIKQTRTITDKRGEQKTVEVIDSSLAMVKHKIRESLQNRLVGMPVHRSMQITENRHISGQQAFEAGGLNFSTDDLSKMPIGDLKNLVTGLEAESAGPAPALKRGENDEDVIDVSPNTDGK